MSTPEAYIFVIFVKKQPANFVLAESAVLSCLTRFNLAQTWHG